MSRWNISDNFNEGFLTNDAFTRLLTPKAFRSPGRVFGMGHWLAVMIGLALYLPVVIAYARHWMVTRSILLILLRILVLLSAFSLVAYARMKIGQMIAILETFIPGAEAHPIKKQVTFLLKPAWQIAFGLVFASIIVAFAQPVRQLQDLDLLSRISVSLSVGYTAFFVSIGPFILFCALIFVRRFLNIKYEITGLSLLPYQSLPLRSLVDQAASITLTGAVISAVISGLVIWLAWLSYAALGLYWMVILIGVLVLSWFVTGAPYLLTQMVVNRIIHQAKEKRCQQIQAELAKAISRLDGNKKETVENLEKIQGMYDLVYRSQEVIFNWSSLGKFFTSLLVSLLPLAANYFFDTFQR